MTMQAMKLLGEVEECKQNIIEKISKKFDLIIIILEKMIDQLLDINSDRGAFRDVITMLEQAMLARKVHC